MNEINPKIRNITHYLNNSNIGSEHIKHFKNCWFDLDDQSRLVIANYIDRIITNVSSKRLENGATKASFGYYNAIELFMELFFNRGIKIGNKYRPITNKFYSEMVNSLSDRLYK